MDQVVRGKLERVILLTFGIALLISIGILIALIFPY